MKLEDLPTNGDRWQTYDWEYALAGSEFYEGATAAPLGAEVEDITAERIARVDLWDATSEDGYGQVDFVALVELTDGTWAACMVWTDTTGWGCRQGVTWRVCGSRDDAIRYALDQDGRERLGVKISEVEPSPVPSASEITP